MSIYVRPPLVEFTVEPDPPGYDWVLGDFAYDDYTDEFDVDSPISWAPHADPPLVAFGAEADPPPLGDTEGGFSSLFYEPAFYDTSVVGWAVID